MPSGGNAGRVLTYFIIKLKNLIPLQGQDVYFCIHYIYSLLLWDVSRPDGNSRRGSNSCYETSTPERKFY